MKLGFPPVELIYAKRKGLIKGGCALVELIRAKRKILINWFTEHARIVLINLLTNFSGKTNCQNSLLFLANFFRQKHEPIKLRKIFNYKNIQMHVHKF